MTTTPLKPTYAELEQMFENGQAHYFELSDDYQRAHALLLKTLAFAEGLQAQLASSFEAYKYMQLIVRNAGLEPWETPTTDKS